MTKYMSVIVGAVVVFLGVVGLMAWWCDFITIVKGTIPLMCVFGGIIALIAGISEIKDESARKQDTK